MKIGELALKIAVHRVHAWRLASAGVIPGTKRTKGGQFYFVECDALSRWIGKMRSYKFRLNVMKRAYQKDYGNQIVAQKKEEAKLRRFYKQSVRSREADKNYVWQYDELFVHLFLNTDELIQILEELTGWVDCPLKWEVQKTSQDRLVILRDLINVWLNQQQSGRT